MGLPDDLLEYRHVDVFTERPYAGNGLVVVFGGVERPAGELLSIAQEMRQFETIFVDVDADRGRIGARVFTVEEELPFAGHPVIGAAAAAHERTGGGGAERSWVFRIAGREIDVASRPAGRYYGAEMDQGLAEVSEPVSDRTVPSLLEALSLDRSDLAPLPLQVVSTGLPYLIVPVAGERLERARIVVDDLEARLDAIGAKFVYVFDPEGREGRTWDNLGAVEDVATGSAAGPAATYLVEHRLADSSEEILLRQGRFAGRPSAMAVRLGVDGRVRVGGSVASVASGTLDARA